MNFKTTLILIVLLAAAGLALFFTRDKGAATTPPIADDANPTSVDAGAKLTDVDSKDVTRITVTGDAAFTAEKVGTDWRITAPFTAPADTFEVDALVRDITDAKSHGQVDPSAATGLSSPKYHVTLSTPAKTLTLAVGANSAVGDSLYVQLDGQSKADIIPSSLSDKLAKGAVALRKANLVTASADDVKQMTITRADGSKLSIAKIGAAWQIVAPVQAPADESAASDLVFALTGLRADSFMDAASLPKDAMGRPQLTVSYTNAVYVAPPATQPASLPVWKTVKFGSYDDVLKKNVFVAVDGLTSIAKVTASSLDSFKKTELDLRDKKVVDLDPASITKLTLTTGGSAATVLERRHDAAVIGPVMSSTTQATSKPSTAPASKWTANGSSADDTKVTTLLDALHPLRADKYLASITPSTQPSTRYVLNFTTKNSPVAQTITLTDPGHDQPLVGTYNGLTFETARTLATALQGSWTH